MFFCYCNQNYCSADRTEVTDSEDEQEEQKVRVKTGRFRTLVQWTKEQKELTEEYFKRHIKKKISPKRDEVMSLIQEHTNVFHNKTWPVVKIYVCNKFNI